MIFLLKLCVLSIFVVVVECTTGGEQQQRQQCLSLDSGNIEKCSQDWKQMSAFVAGLVDVGRSTAAVVDEDEEDKVKTKSNAITLLIRTASGVIGRGADAMKSLIVSSLMLLTRTVSARQLKTLCYYMSCDNVYLILTDPEGFRVRRTSSHRPPVQIHSRRSSDRLDLEQSIRTLI